MSSLTTILTQQLGYGSREKNNSSWPLKRFYSTKSSNDRFFLSLFSRALWSPLFRLHRIVETNELLNKAEWIRGRTHLAVWLPNARPQSPWLRKLPNSRSRSSRSTRTGPTTISTNSGAATGSRTCRPSWPTGWSSVTSLKVLPDKKYRTFNESQKILHRWKKIHWSFEHLVVAQISENTQKFIGLFPTSEPL